MHSLHQGSKQEDREGLCPSGSEACLQTNDDSEKRPNTSEEQGLRSEADSSCVLFFSFVTDEGFCGRNVLLVGSIATC